MKKVFKKTRKIMSLFLIAATIFSLNIATTYAAEAETDQPIVIGEYDGWLSECIDTENPMTRASVVNVRVNSYATYDSKKGIK